MSDHHLHVQTRHAGYRPPAGPTQDGARTGDPGMGLHIYIFYMRGHTFLFVRLSLFERNFDYNLGRYR